MTDYGKLFSLENKCAVVIGGGGGIGGAIAEGLAAVGANVAIVGRSLEKLRAQAARIRENIGAQVKCFAADCSDDDSVARLYAKVLAELRGADILVNSQGVNKKISALEHPVAEWDEMFAANVKSVMLTCKYFGRHMKEQRYGRIVNLSSINSIRAKKNDISVCYGATKGAINAYSLNLAAGWAEFGITVNCIGPIIVETEMMRPILEKNPEMRASTIAGVPMGRLCKTEDCVGIAIFFASDAANFLTGQVLYPDGGVSIVQ
ncbi:MAG: SDR family oxidoreductase [Candidatus Accumulibacter sp.]|jgi:gluconate 5-dehydrogenase|nr:SDR family oxidoreductase [Accumulibacter sp.]